ncbi:MAG: dihydrolipoamide succinyltransferase, partial [Gammaproteobacteria bacterium]
MTIEIKAPTLPESVPDGTIANWYKDVGDTVARDELLVDIETDKVVIEVVSPTDGTLKEILTEAGTTIVSNQAIGSLLASDGKQAIVAKKAEPVAEVEPASNEAETMISPAAKKLIEENK